MSDAKKGFFVKQPFKKNTSPKITIGITKESAYTNLFLNFFIKPPS